MASLFAITAAANSTRLDDKRQAQTSFSVFNNSGRQLRGRAIIVPDNPASEKWLTLIGEAERTFPIAGTQDYSVQIVVPPDASPGNYQFRLDEVNTENPNEDVTEGPMITFEVPALLPKPKPFPIWIPLVIVAVVLLLAGVIIALVVKSNNDAHNATATATAVAQATGTAQAIANAHATETARAIANARATQTAQAIANAHATQTAQAMYSGVWMRNASQPSGVLRLEISNSGTSVTVHVVGDLMDQVIIMPFGSDIWMPTFCGECSWGTRTVQLNTSALSIPLVGTDARVLHTLTIRLTADHNTIIVGDNAVFEGRTTTNTSNFHR